MKNPTPKPKGEPILATDGTNSLLKDSKIARIGTIYVDRFSLNKFVIPRVVMVEFDFEEDGRKDYFFFEEGRLKYNSIHETDKPPGVFNAYNDCIYLKEPVSFTVFMNLVITEYLRYALGFNEDKPSN